MERYLAIEEHFTPRAHRSRTTKQAIGRSRAARNTKKTHSQC
jgi:hypothetical protein